MRQPGNDRGYGMFSKENFLERFIIVVGAVCGRD